MSNTEVQQWDQKTFDARIQRPEPVAIYFGENVGPDDPNVTEVFGDLPDQYDGFIVCTVVDTTRVDVSKLVELDPISLPAVMIFQLRRRLAGPMELSNADLAKAMKGLHEPLGLVDSDKQQEVAAAIAEGEA
ncbi:MAG: hypothetical protein V1926_00190 [Candidatus Peregrinibacteria bacterium]